MQHEGGRLGALEGLRGIAAIVVVAFHFLFFLYPAMFQHTGGPAMAVRHGWFENFFYNNPLEVFLSGTFAVAIFFVLSGFVLSIGFFQTGDRSIVKKLATKRYLRLMIPALAAVMICWILISLHLSHSQSAYGIVQDGAVGTMWDFQPNFFSALVSGVWGSFSQITTYGNASLYSNPYDTVLWTMPFELFGSFMVFASLLLFGNHPKRWLLYGVLVLLLFQTWFVGFILGMILADAYAHKAFPFKTTKSILLGIIALVVGLFFGGYPPDKPITGIYQSLFMPQAGQVISRTIFLSIGALLVVVAVLTLPRLTHFLERRSISKLGKYTFSLYLMHMPVLLTVGMGAFVWLYHHGFGFNRAVLITAIITVPVICAVTWVFEKYVDAPAIDVSNMFTRWFLSKKKNNTINPIEAAIIVESEV